MCQTQNTPIIDALKKYTDNWTVRFHMPGHKGGQAADNLVAKFLGDKVFAADVTNVPGLDDLHQAHGVIRKAQELAAGTFGADFTYFLINGSSCGLQALVMAVCGPGEKILAPRNMHRSILSGIILSGAVPVFFRPEYDCHYKIPLGTCPETIARSLECHPDVKAVILVNPTYHGITSDVSSIAKIVHARNIPLVVDEAHGPHLHFHEVLPATALEGGADAAVQGTHKILSAFTQAAMLHLKSSLIDRQRLEAALRLLQSTSTSYLLLASLDAARAQMEACGRQLIQEAIELAAYLREKINRLNGFSSFGEEMVGKPGVFGLDPTKVTISVRGLQVTGLWAEQWLRERHGIQVEMSDMFNLLLIVTFGNFRSDADRLLKALQEMGQYAAQNNIKAQPYWAAGQVDAFPGIPDLVITPREAFWAPVAAVPLAEAVGRVSAETIACYPPGIPVICPGEKVTGEIVEYLNVLRNVGMHFQGCHDASLETVHVVK
ncbi:MAG: aminotransferase class I/II-fold pyridoxal phosphate-dependent enzyme [Bacillota bacterium]